MTEQPLPVPNAERPSWDFVCEDVETWNLSPTAPLLLRDMRARDRVGRERYGAPLQPHNGRDSLRDAYEEALDLLVYTANAVREAGGEVRTDRVYVAALFICNDLRGRMLRRDGR